MNENFDLMKAARNNYVYKTKDAQEALDFLSKRDESTLVTIANDITVTPLAPGDVRLFPQEYVDNNVVHRSIATDLEKDYDPVSAYEECARETKLLVSRSNGFERYLMRPTAIHGLLSTTLVDGTGWGILQSKNNNDFALAINCFLQVRPRNMTLIEVWGAVTGIASDRYTYLPQRSLLEAFLLSAASGDGEMTEFMYSHELTVATAEFPKEQVRKYSLDQLGFDPDNSRMLMKMRTSDTLNSAATVYVEITDGERSMATTGVYEKHMATTVQKFSERCAYSLNVALRETMDQLIGLTKYDLKYAESTLREAGKRAGIPDCVTVKAIKEGRIDGIDFENMSAFDGYLFICNLIDSSKVRKSKMKSFCGNEDLISNYIKTEAKAKVAMLKWTEIDAEKRYKDIKTLDKDAAEDPNQLSLFDAT